jgi:hypothetical protein
MDGAGNSDKFEEFSHPLPAHHGCAFFVCYLVSSLAFIYYQFYEIGVDGCSMGMNEEHKSIFNSFPPIFIQKFVRF